MNVDSGEMYYTKSEIEAAKKRGEPIVGVSEEVANLIEAGNVAKAEMMRHLETAPRRIVWPVLSHEEVLSTFE